MRRRRLRRDQRGLTLAEILIAVAIIGIGLVGLAVVIPVSSYGVQEGNQMSTATFLAEQRMEQIRNATWTATTDNLTVANFPADTPLTGYTRTVTISDCGVSACAGITSATMRLVRVSVTYRPLTGAGVSPTNKTVSIDWLVSRK